MAAEKIQLGHRLLGLKRYDAMLQAISECHRVDEAKEIRDKVRALEVYAAQAVNYEPQYRASEIRIRAERRTGELLKEAEEKGQRASQGGTGKNQSQTSRRSMSAPTLSDYGITQDQSSKWQQLAEIPEVEFEQAVRAPGASTDGILRQHSNKTHPPEPPSFNAVSLLVWGSLREYVIEANYKGKPLIEADPKQIIAGINKEDWKTRKQIEQWAPKVADWLIRLAQEAKQDAAQAE